MTARVRGSVALRAVVLVVGAAFLGAVATGRSRLFVRAWFVPILLVTGLALIVLVPRARGTATRAAAAVLLLPLIVGALLSPARVGAIATLAGGSAPLQSRIGEHANPLLTSRSSMVTLLDILLAQREAGAVALDGRTVVVDGIVGRDGRSLLRLVMVCCAADARPVSVPVLGTLPRPGSWVRVHGRLTARGQAIALEVRDVHAIPAPESPFL
jgi:uncharacterized repeat protein (TIGR03943 family)